MLVKQQSLDSVDVEVELFITLHSLHLIGIGVQQWCTYKFQNDEIVDFLRILKWFKLN